MRRISWEWFAVASWAWLAVSALLLFVIGWQAIGLAVLGWAPLKILAVRNRRLQEHALLGVVYPVGLDRKRK